MIIHAAKRDESKANPLSYIMSVTFDSTVEVQRSIDMTMAGDRIRLYHPNHSERDTINDVPARGLSFTEALREEIKLKLSGA